MALPQPKPGAFLPRMTRITNLKEIVALLDKEEGIQ